MPGVYPGTIYYCTGKLVIMPDKTIIRYSRHDGNPSNLFARELIEVLATSLRPFPFPFLFSPLNAFQRHSYEKKRELSA